MVYGSITASISSTDILEYTYDKRGYVASVTKNNDHAVGLVYDGNGNLTLLKELTTGKYTPDNITSYVYDSRGYLTEVCTGGTITYKTTGYDRDGLPILTEIAEDGELLASYISRADGLLEQTTDGAGNVARYQYNQQKQVTGLTVTATDGTMLYSETNTYDKNGSLLKQVVSGEGYDNETLSYTYDALDRLLSETKNGVTASYTYDSMGNRLTKTENGVTTSYVYDLCNKLLSETTGSEVTKYAYDALGNLAAKVSSEGTTTYAYDALNQLLEVVNPDGTWQSNTYDASGIRSMIAEDGVTTEFMTFNGLVLGGYNKDGEQTEHYYYGSSLLAYGRNADEESSLYYYLKNSHGDVIGFTDNNGTLTQNYRYDAFGTLTSVQSINENGILVEAETALSRFLYAGEQLDSTTGLYYLRARQYDTVIGRFTQEDTYLGDGRNLYVYVSNNPLKYVDPSGHCSKKLGYTLNRLSGSTSVARIEKTDTVGEYFDDLLIDTVNGAWYIAVKGYNALTSAGIGAIDGLTENPFSIITNSSLKPYAKSEVSYDVGKLGVEVIESLIGGRIAGLGANALRYVPALYISGGPVVGGVVTAADILVIAAASEMSIASSVRASQTLGDLVKDVSAEFDKGTAESNISSLTPKGAGRRGAFREAKRKNKVPVSEQPIVKPNVDRRGKKQPGKIYEFENGVQIRDDIKGER